MRNPKGTQGTALQRTTKVNRIFNGVPLRQSLFFRPLLFPRMKISVKQREQGIIFQPFAADNECPQGPQ